MKHLFAISVSLMQLWGIAAAQDFTVHGMATLRAVAPSDETSWHAGGFGRLRYGSNNADDVEFFLSDLYLEPRLQATSSLSAMMVLKHDPEQREAVDIVEGYMQYKPVSTGALRWSAKAGAFFPPVSFENDDIGWTSPYAVTSSAINSWLGEEVRIIGAEGRLEWRTQQRSITFLGALYGWNDPVGVLIAVRGWGLTDRSTGLFDKVRLHDPFVTNIGKTPPYSETEIHEIDDRVGWYAGVEFEQNGRLKLRALYYDNRGDPAATRDGQRAWLTQYWSAGAELAAGRWTLISQGMTGHTDVDTGFSYLATDFSSAFILAARDIGDFRLSARAEFFRTDETRNTVIQARKEDGGAVTLAARWYVDDHIQIAGEALMMKSDRPERVNTGLPEEATENQFQLLMQLRF